MDDIVLAAQRLRAVRQASRQFLTLWTLDRSLQNARALDRFAADIEKHPHDAVALDSAMPENRFSYRRACLDDN